MVIKVWQEMNAVQSESNFERMFHSFSFTPTFVEESACLHSEIFFEDWKTDLLMHTPMIDSIPYDPEDCRFSNILSPRKGRVELLDLIEPHHIHANYLSFSEDFPVICSQYPLENRIEYFWQMAQNAPFILDMSHEDDKSSHRLVEYAPKLNENKQFGAIKVYCEQERSIEGMFSHLYLYRVKIGDGDEFQVLRLHFHCWLDWGWIPPSDMDFLVSAIEYFQSNLKQPIIFHCVAGIGRSVTLTIAYALSKLIKSGEVNHRNLKEHISKLVIECRRMRGKSAASSETLLKSLFYWGNRKISGF